MGERHDIWELSRFLTELSVIDYYFVIHKPSTVALAALLNSLEDMHSVAQAAKDEFLAEISKVAALNPARQEVLDCRNRLRLLYAQGEYTRPTVAAEIRTETVSPVCVSYGVNPQAYPHADTDTKSNRTEENTFARSGTSAEQ